MSFLHGVETLEVQRGAVSVRQLRTSVVGLVGIAPKGPAQALTLVTSETAAEQFGAEVPGATIPQALKAIFASGTGYVLVVNVFDKATHTQAVTAETLTITQGRAKTANPPVPNLAADFTLTNNAGNTTYTYGTHYTVDDFGNIRVLDFTAIPEGSQPKATYRRLNRAAVTASHINGAITNGVRTGAKLFELAFNTFGVKPKLLIAPWFSHIVAVRNNLVAMADRYRGIALIDAGDDSWTPADAIADRGVAGEEFNTASTRAYLLYPSIKAYSPYTDADENRPASPYVAGLIGKVDADLGYWYSPSNKAIPGITGVARTIEWDGSSANTEANLLNEAGITTVVSGFGTGLRLWGNRSAGHPTVTTPDQFISVRRVGDALYDALELTLIQFIDRPITRATIASIRETVNAFINTLIGRGALVDGECLYLDTDNPPTQLAQGQLKFRINYMPPTPAERITLEAFIDINMLRFGE